MPRTPRHTASRASRAASLLLLVLVAAAAAAAAVAGCRRAKTSYTTTAEIVQLRRVGRDPNVAPIIDLELRYVDCPGDARKVMRGDRAFGACGTKFKQGDRVTVEVVLSYSSERGVYHSEVVRLDDCPIQLDLKDEANYEMVEECRDVVASGAVVGVHCDRGRSEPMIAKCPWLRRR